MNRIPKLPPPRLYLDRDKLEIHWVTDDLKLFVKNIEEEGVFTTKITQALHHPIYECATFALPSRWQDLCDYIEQQILPEGHK